MTETKLAESISSNLSLQNPYYYIYTSNCDQTTAKKQESSLGTAIAIIPSLRPYIHNIKKTPGTAIAIDFFFPQRYRLRVISTYLPNNNNLVLHQTQNIIQKWIEEATSSQYHIIIIGDFNFDYNKSSKKKPTIFNTMSQHNLTSILQYYHIQDYTWSRQNSHSQIDDM